MHQYIIPEARRRRQGRTAPTDFFANTADDHYDAQQTWTAGNVLDTIPAPVRFQEGVELQRLRHTIRRQRKLQPPTKWERVLRRYIYPYLRSTLTVICLYLPAIYGERYRKLVYTVFEPGTWPHMFTEPTARRRAQVAWKTYATTMTDEWSSANIITALILSAAGSFLAIEDISNITRHALVMSMLAALASLMHATYHAHYFRSIAEDEHFVMLQLRCYINCYRPIMEFLLCQPMLNLCLALVFFALGVLAYLWPADPPVTWKPKVEAKVLILAFFVVQLAILAVAYKWHRIAFYTTNELLVGEIALVEETLRNETERAAALMARIRRDAEAADLIRVLKVRTASRPLASIASDAGPSSTRIVFPQPPRPVEWLAHSLTVLEHAVPFGYENIDGEEASQLYVGRALLDGCWYAGKINQYHILNIAHNGRSLEIPIDHEALCGDPHDFAWLSFEDGERFDDTAISQLPQEYVLMPLDQEKRPDIFIASAMLLGGRHMGEVARGSGKASIPFGSQVLITAPFRVLLIRKAQLARVTAHVV